VRTAKLATIDAADAVRVGGLSAGARAGVTRQLRAVLGTVLDTPDAA
jgi:hypothetical protein